LTAFKAVSLPQPLPNPCGADKRGPRMITLSLNQIALFVVAFLASFEVAFALPL
jgi:hypothetical protein